MVRMGSVREAGLWQRHNQLDGWQLGFEDTGQAPVSSTQLYILTELAKQTGPVWPERGVPAGCR